jgi:hypothetical protein
MNALALIPEAYLALGLGAVLVAVGALWTPLLLLAPVLALAAGGLALRAVSAATGASFSTRGLSAPQRIARRTLVALLHVLQPLVRLEGRLRHGLSPWRTYAKPAAALPTHRQLERWSETWVDPTEWLRAFERHITSAGAVVRCGGDFDSWDLETRGGVLAGVRIVTAVEEHGGGRQLVRIRCRPTWSRGALVMIAILSALAVVAALDGATAAAIILAVLGVALGLRALAEASAALALTVRVVGREQR